MKPLILPDSSFYIKELRKQKDPFRFLSMYRADYDFATCGMVRAEVLPGIRGPAGLRRSRQQFAAMLEVPTGGSVWEAVIALATELECAGRRLPLPDLIIAACAIDIGATVFTYDCDFDRIPQVKVIHTLELLPPLQGRASEPVLP